MIQLEDEKRFYGKSGTAFEAYMFATADKHIERHKDFSDMEITVLSDGEKTVFSGDTIEKRKEALKYFNKVLKDSKGIAISKDAGRLFMNIAFLDSDEDYEDLKNELLRFASERKSTLAFVTHFHQTTPDGTGMMDKHVHTINDVQGLVDFLCE